MASSYPSNPEQAGKYLSPDDFEHKPEKKRNMTALEIGVIVGAVIAFFLVLFFVFFYRHLEGRSRAKRAARRAEEEGLSNDQQQAEAGTPVATTGSKMHLAWTRLTNMLKGRKASNA